MIERLQMPDFITLACPSCGGNLALTDDTDRFDCPHCGRTHLVRRAQNNIDLLPLAAQLTHIAAGVDRSANELAVPRLKEDQRRLRGRVKDLTTDLIRDRSALMSAAFWARTNTLLAIALVPGSAILAVKGSLGWQGWGVAAVAFIALIGAVSRHLAVRRLKPQVIRTEQKLSRCADELEEVEGQLDQKLRQLRRT